MVAEPCLALKRPRPWGTLKILLRPPGRWQASAALGLHEGAEDNAYGHESNRPRLAAPSRSCTLAAAGFGGNEGAPEEPQRGPSRAHFRPPRRHRFRQNSVLISDCQILAFSRCAPFLTNAPVTHFTIHAAKALNLKTLGLERPWGRAELGGPGVPKSGRGAVAAHSEVKGLRLAWEPGQRRRARNEAARREVRSGRDSAG